jgi:cystathionine beta-synthase
MAEDYASQESSRRRVFAKRIPGPQVWHHGSMHTSTRALPGVQDSILDAIGGTPLVRLSRMGAGLAPQLVAKVEALNPGGSIKDRVAVALIEAAERAGDLKPGGTIVEPTSGNTGTGLAIAARLKGYRVIAVMPDKMSAEKIDLLRAYGAEVVVAPTEVPPDSPESYYRVADRLAQEIPGAFQPNQYANPANPAAHHASTGPELWEQSEGRITHLVAGIGTGGTITGAGRYLKERNPAIVVVGADPYGSVYSGGEARPYLVEGVGEDFWPATFDPSVVDRYITVTDKDSFLTARKLARLEGILAGGSAGTALHAALQVAAEVEDPEAMVAVILPDGGRSYLSKVYSDAWMTQYGFLEREGDQRVGDVLQRKHDVSATGQLPPLVTVHAHQKVADAVALLHEHGVSQLPVVSAHDATTVVGSVGERGLLKHAVGDPSLLGARIAEVMEPPLYAVSSTDPVRDAVELLVGERQALLVTEDGRPAGIVTRADLLEALAR